MVIDINWPMNSGDFPVHYVTNNQGVPLQLKGHLSNFFTKAPRNDNSCPEVPCLAPREKGIRYTCSMLFTLTNMWNTHTQ